MSLFDGKMTNPHSERHSKLLKDTVKGMAHFAGTGPAGTKCSQCEHFKSFSVSGTPIRTKQQPCQKFRRMMKAKTSPKIPRKTSSCMFFESIDAAQPTKEREIP